MRADFPVLIDAWVLANQGVGDLLLPQARSWSRIGRTREREVGF